jgi:thioredoxin-related protein
MKNGRLLSLILAALIALAGAGFAQTKTRIEPVFLEDGRYTQSWFLLSFLDLKEDLAEAASQGKRLALLWDQRGCPYCQEMMNVNLADPDVNNYIREHFNVVQLDLYGSREVTDFDGEVLSEKALARKYGVLGTPTIIFAPPTVAGVEGKKGRAAEVARMPGYFKPGHFEAMFAYVFDRAYEKQSFLAYLRARPKDSANGKS